MDNHQKLKLLDLYNSAVKSSFRNPANDTIGIIVLYSRVKAFSDSGGKDFIIPAQMTLTNTPQIITINSSPFFKSVFSLTDLVAESFSKNENYASLHLASGSVSLTLQLFKTDAHRDYSHFLTTLLSSLLRQGTFDAPKTPFIRTWDFKLLKIHKLPASLVMHFPDGSFLPYTSPLKLI